MTRRRKTAILKSALVNRNVACEREVLILSELFTIFFSIFLFRFMTPNSLNVFCSVCAQKNVTAEITEDASSVSICNLNKGLELFCSDLSMSLTVLRRPLAPCSFTSTAVLVLHGHHAAQRRMSMLGRWVLTSCEFEGMYIAVFYLLS